MSVNLLVETVFPLLIGCQDIAGASSDKQLHRCDVSSRAAVDF